MKLSREPKNLSTITIIGLILGIFTILGAFTFFIVAGIAGGIDPYSIDYTATTITPDSVELFLSVLSILFVFGGIFYLIFGSFTVVASILAKKSKNWLIVLIVIGFLSGGIFGIIMGILGIVSIQDWAAIETEDRLKTVE